MTWPVCLQFKVERSPIILSISYNIKLHPQKRKQLLATISGNSFATILTYWRLYNIYVDESNRICCWKCCI